MPANQYTLHGPWCRGTLGVQAIQAACGLHACSQQSHWPMAHELARIARRTRPTTFRTEIELARSSRLYWAAVLGAASNPSSERQRTSQKPTSNHGRYKSRLRFAPLRCCQAAASPPTPNDVRDEIRRARPRTRPPRERGPAAVRGHANDKSVGEGDSMCVVRVVRVATCPRNDIDEHASERDAASRASVVAARVDVQMETRSVCQAPSTDLGDHVYL